MITLEAIEGDYIQTKKNNFFFDVKDLQHPKDRTICFIRFFPSPDGDIILNGVNYKKIYDHKCLVKIHDKYKDYSNMPLRQLKRIIKKKQWEELMILEEIPVICSASVCRTILSSSCYFKGKCDSCKSVPVFIFFITSWSSFYILAIIT